jgi:iron(III) transport system ATP-binding protein
VLIGGTDVTLRAANERNVSMVFQSYALFPHMTVLENVCYGPLSMRIDKAKARDMAREKLKMLGLADFEARLPSELSGGQQQRVAVASVAGARAGGLLFDEPLSNLDAKLRRRVREEIRELQQALALTVLYVTHDQEEALAVSDHIIVMNGGTIAQQGTPDELYETPQSRFLADFIGDANLVDGELVVDAARHVVRRRRHQGGQVRRRRHGGGPATLAVRPQRLRLVDAAQGVLPGVVKRASYLGSRIEYVVVTAWGELLVFDVEARTARRREDAVGVAFDRDAVIVLKR